MTIRKVRRDHGLPYETDEEGNRISIEEAEYRRKFVDYRQCQWPDSTVDAIEHYTNDGKDKLTTYRYPVTVGQPRKGIVFFIHGYGDCTERYAFLAEMFAAQGLEFAGIDQCGFGSSEGTTGKIESLDSVLADLHSFNQSY